MGNQLTKEKLFCEHGIREDGISSMTPWRVIQFLAPSVLSTTALQKLYGTDGNQRIHQHDPRDGASFAPPASYLGDWLLA